MAFKTTKKVNKALEARIKSLAKPNNTVKIGVFGTEAKKKHGEKNNLFIAQVHEFGVPSKNIPERSFIRSVAKGADGKQIKKEIGLLYDAVLKGKVTVEQGLEILGLSIVSKIKRKIRAGIKPELKAATKKAKIRNGRAGDTPLIDFGQLINSISHKVGKD